MANNAAVQITFKRPVLFQKLSIRTRNNPCCTDRYKDVCVYVKAPSKGDILISCTQPEDPDPAKGSIIEFKNENVKEIVKTVDLKWGSTWGGNIGKENLSGSNAAQVADLVIYYSIPSN